jgi:hypothetical protein
VNGAPVGVPSLVSAGPFCHVHRAISGVDQLLDDGSGVEAAGTYSCDACDTDTCRCAPGDLGDSFSETLGDRMGLTGLGHLRDQELFAADAGDDGTPAGTSMISDR